MPLPPPIVAPLTDNNYTMTNISESSGYEVKYNFTVDPLMLAEQKWYQNAESVIDRYVTHYICMVGIIGNVINFLVLSRKSLTEHMGRMEKSSHIGLLGLAVSDFFYCLCSIPQVYQPSRFGTPRIDFWHVYSAYGTACINCFLLSSSWLTVSMAVCRYLAICHPLKARQHLGMTASRCIIAGVFLLSILFNLPRFWMSETAWYDCVGGGQSYFNMPGYMQTNKAANMTYTWLYFLFGILFPLLVLTYCNTYLVKAIHGSNKLRRQHSSSSHQEATRIVTLTLCIIVVMYIVLVGPAELVTFWRPYVHNNPRRYGFAVKVCNALQMLNFAVNFILYCVINVHFRKVVRELLLCQCVRAKRHGHKLPDGDSSTQETSIMLSPAAVGLAAKETLVML